MVYEEDAELEQQLREDIQALEHAQGAPFDAIVSGDGGWEKHAMPPCLTAATSSLAPISLPSQGAEQNGALIVSFRAFCSASCSLCRVESCRSIPVYSRRTRDRVETALHAARIAARHVVPARPLCGCCQAG